MQVPSDLNAKGLRVECAMVIYEGLLELVLLYFSERMIGREKERSRIRAVQMSRIRGLLGIRRMDRIPNAWIREFCGVEKKVDESVFRWFGHTERMENDRIVKRVYVGDFVIVA